jgi:hypothetical protein
LKTLLNDHLDGGPYEVVNLAEPGFNTRQEERMLLDVGLALAPDLVLVGVTPNDNQEFALDNGQLLEVRFLRRLRARRDAAGARVLARKSYFYNWLWLQRERFFPDRSPAHDDPLIVDPLRRMDAAARERQARLAVMCFPDCGARDAEYLDPVRNGCRFPEIAPWAMEAGVRISIS